MFPDPLLAVPDAVPQMALALLPSPGVSVVALLATVVVTAIAAVVWSRRQHGPDTRIAPAPRLVGSSRAN